MCFGKGMQRFSGVLIISSLTWEIYMGVKFNINPYTIIYILPMFLHVYYMSQYKNVKGYIFF